MKPEAYLSRETRIRRDAEGRWYDGDEPIDHRAIALAFDRWIDRAEDGRFCLKNKVNWAYVSIEGAPLFVRRIRVEPDAVWLEMSHAREEKLSPETLRQNESGDLYCTAENGMTARFDRSAMFQLSDILAEDAGGLHLVIGGRKVRPPVVADPLKESAAPRAPHLRDA